MLYLHFHLSEIHLPDDQRLLVKTPEKTIKLKPFQLHLKKLDNPEYNHLH